MGTEHQRETGKLRYLTTETCPSFDVLRSVRQEGLWATRVSFVYSVTKNKVYYVLNNDFKNIAEYQF